MTRTIDWKRPLFATALAGLALGSSAPLTAQSAEKQAPVPAGFTSLFDGKTLKGWRGDTAVWSVRDGAITASTDQPITHNTYLILDKPYANFELRFKYRWLTPVGNSGIQFRSGVADGNYVLAGMQANVTPITPAAERFAMLYEEIGERQEMVLLGQRAEVSRRQASHGGQGRIVRTVLATTNPRDAILKSIKPYPEWNEDVLIVHGNHMVHVVNGLVAFDATDKDPLGAKDGLIGIQAHAGPAMTVQFKDMVIRPLTSWPNLAGRFVSNPGPAPEPSRTYKDSTKVNFPDTPLP